MGDSQGSSPVTSNNYSTWVAGGAVILSLLGSLLAFNTAQTTMANNQTALALELKKVHKEMITYIDKEMYVVNDRITRFESDVHKKDEDFETRLRASAQNNHKAVVRAEKNETLLKLVTEGKLP